MLKEFIKETPPEKAKLKSEVSEVRAMLGRKQLEIKEAKLPIIVIFEGWGASGKGSILGKIIRDMDPRFFEVKTMAPPTSEEKRYLFLWRYMREIPENGKIKFFDRMWMEEVVKGRMEKHISEAEYQQRIQEINTTERQLIDNGYLIMKFFFQIDQKEQKKRLKNLEEEKNTNWRVTGADWSENKNYDEYFKAYDAYLNDTNRAAAPWYIIDSENKKWAERQVLRYLLQGIDTALKNQKIAVPIPQNIFRLEKIGKLADFDLTKKANPDKYNKELNELQERLNALHYEIYRRKIPVVIAYEGWDAAGKGGNIKRITGALDPRGYIVQPIASPEPHEKNRHYLWRFWTRLPKTGHITIFDRTWYGRVMVERLEGFASENEWQRAYNEINEFEKMLSDWGAVIIKFWVQIDKDTQLARFTDRQNTPEKQWKITDEDWRNREKWDLYEVAVNEMLQKTNTTFAPWHVLESNDKKYARLKALKIVIEALEKAAHEQDKRKKKD